MRLKFLLAFFLTTIYCHSQDSWVRINQLGYLPGGVKVAVWCSDAAQSISSFHLIDSATGKIVFTGKPSKPFGEYGPFKQTHRLDFSKFSKSGKYYLKAGKARSPIFRIADDVYAGAADFCLRYMRQQRCGFNPFLKDSCHTHDGYSMYGEVAGIKDSTHIDAVGGWHDASDYLQYVTTSANATYHLLMAYRDFPKVFSDEKDWNGLDGKNGRADVLDEAKWGIDWLKKMNPKRDVIYNQIADDRDHMGFRIPKEDSFYGKGYERPLYFLTGDPQGLFKYRNKTTGTSSTGGKIAAVFALSDELYSTDSIFRSSEGDGKHNYYARALDAIAFGEKKLGTTQTAPGKAPYYYEEENWSDDMELAYASTHSMIASTNNTNLGDNGHFLRLAYSMATREPITPWFGTDTARHYQWYPFVNIGRYELLKQIVEYTNDPPTNAARIFKKETLPQLRDTLIKWYREGIEKVWKKAKGNAFYRGVPFIWCSNNLTTSFAIQCYWYRQLTGKSDFQQLEQANFDWLFGVNPWGTSMVYGLPSGGDTPTDPHSAFTKLKNYPIDGGLVDGPVYGSIFARLIGIKIYNGDEYAQFQSKLAVYHDDYGDYSTNEPTMDGTASLVYLLAAMENEAKKLKK